MDFSVGIIIAMGLLVGGILGLIASDPGPLPEPVDVQPEEVVEEVVGPQTHTVDIAIGSGGMGCEEDNTCFLPYEVVVNAGDTVLWDNIDDVLHTVNSRDEGLFDSDLISAGDTFDVVFEEPGTFDYICIVHPWMLGTVTVE